MLGRLPGIVLALAVDITQRGRPVAALAPLDALPPQPGPEEVWARLEELGKEIAHNWQSEKSAVEILAEMRR